MLGNEIKNTLELCMNLRITLKLRTGVADTADALSTKETALGYRSLLSTLVSIESNLFRLSFQLQLTVLCM